MKSDLIEDIGDLVVPEEYQKICINYGLDHRYAGVRLWMTDDTTITENFSNEYGANAIQGLIRSHYF